MSFESVMLNHAIKENHRLPDSIYMNYLEQANSQPKFSGYLKGMQQEGHWQEA